MILFRLLTKSIKDWISLQTPIRILRASMRWVYRSKTEYSGQALSYGFTLVCRIRGFPAINTIHLNGKDIEATTCRDNCSTYVSVGIHPSGKEEYEFLVEF